MNPRDRTSPPTASGPGRNTSPGSDPSGNTRARLRSALVADLDGTLLHAEEEAVAVLGRSGYRYLSGRAARLLERISRVLPVVIATGRNALSVKRLVDQLPGVRFGGFVLENGFVTKTSVDDAPQGPNPWDRVAEMFPHWERLQGYEQCLGFIPGEEPKRSQEALDRALTAAGLSGYIYPERHKLFVYPSVPNKLPGLVTLGMQPLLALGDEINDLEMLQASSHPATLDTAHEQVRTLVRRKGGYCSRLASHTATEDLLTWAYELACRRFGGGDGDRDAPG